MHKKILLLNQGKTENIGDKAINLTITNYLQSRGIEVNNECFWCEKEVFGKHYDKYPKLVRKALWCSPLVMDCLNKIRSNRILGKNKYDAIVIGGGELLSSHLGFNSSIRTWCKLAEKNKIRLYLIGVSGNELKPRKQKQIIKALNSAKMILVRDNYTKQLLNKYGIKNCDRYPDVVFSYRKIIRKNTTEKTSKQSVILTPICFYDAIKNNLKIDNEESYIQYLLSKVKKYRNKEIYICNTAPEDEAVSKRLYETMRKDKYNVTFRGYTRIEDYIRIAEKSEIAISARMHAMILALIYGCKIEPIPFKEKLINFNEEYKKINITSIEHRSLQSLEILTKAILNDK